jgi:hypothetical protein
LPTKDVIEDLKRVKQISTRLVRCNENPSLSTPLGSRQSRPSFAPN